MARREFVVVDTQVTIAGFWRYYVVLSADMASSLKTAPGIFYCQEPIAANPPLVKVRFEPDPRYETVEEALADLRVYLEKVHADRRGSSQTNDPQARLGKGYGDGGTE